MAYVKKKRKKKKVAHEGKTRLKEGGLCSEEKNKRK